MLQTFREGGYAFIYPGNWELIEPSFDELPYTVTVQSPDGAYWSLAIYPVSRDPSALVAEAVDVMRAEYDDFETEEMTLDLPAELEPVGTEMTFIYLDFVVTSQAIGFRRGRATCLIQRQAESREFARVAPVFDAMAESFLRDGELPGASE